MISFCIDRKEGAIEGVWSMLTCLAVALTFTILSLGCSEKPPLEVGFVGGVTGRVADLGMAGRNGAILAIEHRNAKGGVKGRQVKLLVKDDKQENEAARGAVQELVDRKVEAIIGHMTSAMSVITVDIVNDAGVLMLSPTVTTEELTGIDDHFFRVSATTADYAKKMADYLYDEVNVRRVVCVFDLRNEAYTKGWYESFKKQFKALRGELVEGVAFTSGSETPYDQLASKALEIKPDAIILVTDSMDAALISQQLDLLGSKVQVATSEWASTEQLTKLGGNSVEDTIVSQFFQRDMQKPSYLDFVKKYKERFSSEPGFASVASFDAANLIMDALEQKREGETLKQAILRIGTFAGVQGAIEIDAMGESNRKTFLSVISDGAFFPVE